METSTLFRPERSSYEKGPLIASLLYPVHSRGAVVFLHYNSDSVAAASPPQPKNKNVRCFHHTISMSNNMMKAIKNLSG